MEPSARFGPPFRALLLHHFVTFAGRHFQLGPVDNIDVSALVRNQACLLQDACSHRDTGSAGAQHVCQKLLGQCNEVRSNAVLAHQQPSRQPLIHFVKPIAERRPGFPAYPEPAHIVAAGSSALGIGAGPVPDSWR